MSAREIERLWRQSGLPEYFLGNGGTNDNLYKFAASLYRAGQERGFERAAGVVKLHDTGDMQREDAEARRILAKLRSLHPEDMP